MEIPSITGVRPYRIEDPSFHLLNKLAHVCVGLGLGAGKGGAAENPEQADLT